MGNNETVTIELLFHSFPKLLPDGEIKRSLLLGKLLISLDSIFKSRRHILLAKIHQNPCESCEIYTSRASRRFSRDAQDKVQYIKLSGILETSNNQLGSNSQLKPLLTGTYRNKLANTHKKKQKRIVNSVSQRQKFPCISSKSLKQFQQNTSCFLMKKLFIKFKQKSAEQLK